MSGTAMYEERSLTGNAIRYRICTDPTMGSDLLPGKSFGKSNYLPLLRSAVLWMCAKKRTESERRYLMNPNMINRNAMGYYGMRRNGMGQRDMNRGCMNNNTKPENTSDCENNNMKSGTDCGCDNNTRSDHNRGCMNNTMRSDNSCGCMNNNAQTDNNCGCMGNTMRSNNHRNCTNNTRSDNNCGCMNNNAETENNCTRNNMRSDRNNCGCADMNSQQLMNMNRNQLLSYLNQVSFSMFDTVLFLDTHPTDREAIAYFNEMKQARVSALKIYQQRFGPLLLDDVDADCEWTWGMEPLPWETCKY